ncbi:MAG: peroxiredoxin [Rhodospirillaceae bacterium]
MSAIKTGDKLPSMTLKTVEGGEMKEGSTDTLFGQGRHVIFAVPGAFTPTCTAKHLPGFIEKAGDLRAKGIDRIACLAVNDPFVMKAWSDSASADVILMLADGSAELTRALGLEMDGAKYAMGTRSQRFAMVVNDGRVEHLFVEAPGDFSVSSAENVLRNL